MGAPIRQFGTFEQLFWLRGQISRIHFLLAAEIEGTASPAEWRTALNVVQQRHPLLHSGFRQQADSSLRFTAEPGNPIPLRVIVGEQLSRWQGQLELELSLPFTANDVPLIRAVLIEYPDRNIIILTAHHMIGDGHSLSFIVRDLLEVLSGKTIAPLSFPPSIDDLLSRTNAGQDIHPIKSPRLTASEVDNILLRGKMNVVPRVHTQQLSPELTNRLVLRARQENASFHGLLVAALLGAGRSLFSKWKDKPVRILSPKSVRELLDLRDESCVCCCTAKMNIFQPEDNKPLWEQAGFVRTALVEAGELERMRADLMNLRCVLDRMDVEAVQQSVERFLREAVVSNIGQITYSTDFGRLRLASIWGPAIHSGYENEYSLGASTVNGACCLTMTTREPNGHLLLDELVKELNKTGV